MIGNKRLFLFFLFGIFYRVGLLFAKRYFSPPIDQTLFFSFPDEYNYHHIGLAMSESIDNFIHYITLFKFKFGWHHFISIIYTLFGPKPMIIRSINIVVSSLIPLIGYKVAMKFTYKRVGTMALLLLSLSPSLAWYSIFILKDSMVAFLFIMYVYVLLLMKERMKPSNILLSMILFISMTFIKTQLVFVCIPIYLYILFKSIKEKFIFMSILFLSLIIGYFVTEVILLDKIITPRVLPKVSFLNVLNISIYQDYSIYDLLSKIHIDNLIIAFQEYSLKLLLFWTPLASDLESIIFQTLVLPFSIFVFSIFIMGTLFIYWKIRSNVLSLLTVAVCSNWIVLSLFQPHWRYRLIVLPIIIIVSSFYIARLEKSYFKVVKHKI